MTPAGVSECIGPTIRADIHALSAYPVSAATGYIKLDAMESLYVLPQTVQDEVAQAVLDTPLNRYSAAEPPELQAAVKQAFGIPDAAAMLFSNDSDEQSARMRADREPLAAALAALPGVRVFPSAGNFVLARFCGKMDGNAVHQALKTRKILVRNFSHAHPLLADCLRISVGTPAENSALLAALQEILSV